MHEKLAKYHVAMQLHVWVIIRYSDNAQHRQGYRRMGAAKAACERMNAGLIRFEEV
jgi:hypothetical protein